MSGRGTLNFRSRIFARPLSLGGRRRTRAELAPRRLLRCAPVAHALELTAAINLYVDFNWGDHGVLRH